MLDRWAHAIVHKRHAIYVHGLVLYAYSLPQYLHVADDEQGWEAYMTREEIEGGKGPGLS